MNQTLTGLEAMGRNHLGIRIYTAESQAGVAKSRRCRPTNVVSTAADEKPDSTAEAKTDTATKAEGVSP